MPALTLNQAAKASKKAKATLLDAIQSGRLSATRNDLQQWQIDPAELFRVYPQNQQETGHENQDRPQEESQPTTILLAKISFLEHQLATSQDERERERQQMQAQLEREQGQADHWRQQATALLTHQQQQPPAETARPGFWRRLLHRCKKTDA